MTELNATKTVRELALEIPHATRLFEKLGIDYCCGGNKSLAEACERARIEIGPVLNGLAREQAIAKPGEAERWQTAPVSDLISHIISTHHAFTRDEIGRLTALLDKVCGVHGNTHPELNHIRALFRGLSQELTLHMMKEESILFPYVERMEEREIEGSPSLPPPFGTVNNPVRMMIAEHDSAGKALSAIRQASGGYVVPADGCISYRSLYRALEEFENDLHQHIHLENNILFPRAVAMEQESMSKAS